MFSCIKIARRRRDWSPPRGATHVLQWLPSALLTPDPGTSGWWEIQPIRSWLAGEPVDNPPSEDGPADRTEDDLRGFVDASFGMTPFEVEIEADGGISFTTPAYWLTPAGGGW